MYLVPTHMPSTCHGHAGWPNSVPEASHDHQSLLCHDPWKEHTRGDQSMTHRSWCTPQPLCPWWVTSGVQGLHWITDFPAAHSGNLIDNTLLIDILPFPVSLPQSLLMFLRFTSQMNPHIQILVSWSASGEPKLSHFHLFLILKKKN